MLQSPLVTEAMVLSTCNRVEVYAVVDAFHGGLAVVGQVLSDHSGMSMGDLTKYAYVRYSEAAVEHLFAVASGLDSAVIGEQQVLGQVRRAYAAAETNRTVGRVLHELAQRALSVGKRVHSETAHRRGRRLGRLGRTGHGRTQAGRTGRQDRRGDRRRCDGCAVVGAPDPGRHRRRSWCSTGRCPGRSGWPARSAKRACGPQAMTLDRLADALADADVVVSCTGAVSPVVSLADVHHALATARRDEAAEPLVICDLGMPRDVDPAVAGLPGVWVVDVDRIQREPVGPCGGRRRRRRPAASWPPKSPPTWRASGWPRSTPTVTALRQRAADVVEAELLRLENRLPGLESAQREEVARTVRRVVDKLLHAPTVRIKQLASAPGGDSYAEALRELFELDQTVRRRRRQRR